MGIFIFDSYAGWCNCFVCSSAIFMQGCSFFLLFEVLKIRIQKTRRNSADIQTVISH